MRPKTPDNAFEGGGLFAKLGAHEQKTRQLQDQRKREYNDILAAKDGTTPPASVTAPPRKTAHDNATDNQKIEQRHERGGGVGEESTKERGR